MTPRPALFLLLIACATAAAAQEAAAPATSLPGYDSALLETCLTLRRPAQDRSGCIGLAAARCLGDEAVIAPERAADCRTLEAEQWQARLDASLVLLRESAARSDAAEAAAPGSGRASALESAHSTWTAWSGAECAWLQRQEGNSDLAAIDCRIRQTAMRALDLERLLSLGEGP